MSKWKQIGLLLSVLNVVSVLILECTKTNIAIWCLSAVIADGRGARNW